MAISLNDNILTLAPKPSDFRYGPWSSTTHANDQIVIQQRYLGLTVGIDTTSGITEYWYASGVTNPDLVLKQTSGLFSFSGTNVGGGEGSVFKQKSGDLLEFRTLSAGTNVSIQQDSDIIMISTVTPGLRISDGLNTYTGETIDNSITVNISGMTLDNLVITGDTNIYNLSSYTISATSIYYGDTLIENIFPSSGTNIGYGEVGVFAQKNNDVLEFKTLSAGTKISLTGTSDTITINTSGVNSYYIQALAPSGTTEIPLYDGDRWFNTTIGVEFVYIDDGNSSQWVEPILSFTGNTVTGSGTTNYLTKFTSNVGIGDTVLPVVETGSGLVVGGTSTDPSAIFQINSTALGFLPPRMTQVQLNSIANPAVGLMIYQTDGIEGVYVFKSDNIWHLIG